MANNRFNKQVTPKGYKKGGSVKKGLSSRTKGSDKPSKELSFKKKGFSYSGKQMDESLKAKKSRTQSTSRMNPVPYKMGGRVKKMGGGMMNKRPMYKDGSLKPVDPKKQKGLSKLPKEVRNKMGFMKKGGKVNGK